MPGVPYTFGTATSNIPLLELDACFATQITIGTSLVGLGNTANNTLGTGGVVLGSSGTWTPTDASGAGLSFTISRAAYVFIGTGYWCDMTISYPSTANISVASITIPAVSANVPGVGGAFSINAPGYGQPLYGEINPGTNHFGIVTASGGIVSNNGLSSSQLRAQFFLPTV